MQHDTLLTLGGAYSNHIYSVAAAAHLVGLKSIGIIRGEQTLPLNPTLQFASDHGMSLHYVSRSSYREKTTREFMENLHAQFGRFYFIPEGGTNELAVQGCLELGKRIVDEVEFDIIGLPVGTGGTLAGILQALRRNQHAIGFSVLKDGGFLEEEAKRWMPADVNTSWRIETRFDFGGYAKSTQALHDFIRQQHKENNLPLDSVYTAKTLYGIFELVKRGEIPRSATVLMIHTGGLQSGVISQKGH